MRIISVTLAAGLLAGSCLADEGDDTLRFLLSKSELVVAGEITNNTLTVSDELVVASRSHKIKVSSLLKGETAGDELKTHLIRFEARRGDELPCLKKGGKVILFLRKARQGEPQVWITADMWFGVQPYNSVMEQSLKRLAEEKPPKPAVDD